ncbi:unnamed protein product, partial [Prorocentrum cordatum]
MGKTEKERRVRRRKKPRPEPRAPSQIDPCGPTGPKLGGNARSEKMASPGPPGSCSCRCCSSGYARCAARHSVAPGADPAACGPCRPEWAGLARCAVSEVLGRAEPVLAAEAQVQTRGQIEFNERMHAVGTPRMCNGQALDFTTRRSCRQRYTGYGGGSGEAEDLWRDCVWPLHRKA